MIEQAFSWDAVHATLELMRAHASALVAGEPDLISVARAQLNGRAPIVRFICDLAGDAGTTAMKITDEQARAAFDARSGKSQMGILDLLELAASFTPQRPH